MSILVLLIPIALILAGVFVFGFYRAVKGGQYDDLNSPAVRMLIDNNRRNSDESKFRTE